MNKNFNDFLGLNSYRKTADGKEMSHTEQYQTIVNALGYEAVKRCIPYTIEQIREAIKTDRHLNNLPIKAWDLSAGFTVNGAYCTLIGSRLTDLYRKIGVNCFSLSDGVSILKTCAKMWVEEKEEA